MSKGDRRRRDCNRRKPDLLPVAGTRAEGDPDFLAGGVHERQMQLLIDMSALGRPLIALVGQSAIARTAFFRALPERLPEAARVAPIPAAALLSPQALLRMIAPAMGLEVEVDAAADVLRARLHARVLELLGSGTPCVFVVDDAGELDAEALDELVQLAELAAGDDAGVRDRVRDRLRDRVRIILFSRPGIRDALVRAAGEARVDLLFHELTLGRHSVDELRSSLQLHIARAGEAGASPPSETDWSEVFRRSSGLRGRADDEAGRTLREPRSHTQANRVPWIAGCLTAAVLIVVLLLPFSGQAPAPDLSQSAPPMPPSALDPDDGAAAALQGAAAAPEGAAAAPEVADAMPASRSSVATGRAQGVRNAVVPLPEQEDMTAPVVPRPPAPAGGEDIPGDRPDPANGMDRSDAAMLLAAEPARFTIQLLVTSSSERAGGWVAAQSRPESFLQFERVRRSGSQFVVVQGNYADLTAASNALDRVRNETGIAELWIRPMADIQGEIRGG